MISLRHVKALAPYALLTLLPAITSCATQRFSDWFGKADLGVPLTEYQATNGDYFPPFLKNFFAGANFYERDFPALLDARSGIKMIQVKQLNQDKSTQNEANLSWSADGVYLSFESVTNNMRKIKVKDLSGNYLRDLFVIPRNRDTFLDGIIAASIQSYNAGLSWSRDSTRFAFMSNGGIGEYNIYVGAVGSTEKPVAQSPTKDGYATWNPIENELAFISARSGNGDLYLLNLDNSKLTRLSESDEVDIFPEWFPDGQRIAYSSGNTVHNISIVEKDKKRNKWRASRPLTSWRQDSLRPTVSPNGLYIAFYAQSKSGKSDSSPWNIHVVPYLEGKVYNGSELEKMIIAEDVVVDLNTGPAWTPDSKKILYVKRDGAKFNPIYGYDLFSGRTYSLRTNTRMNRDILMSKLGVLSFRAQVGAWDRVFVALTNQGLQLQPINTSSTYIHYL